MTYIGLAQIAVFTALIAGLTKPLGFYMARVFAGEWTVLRPVLGPIEKILYRVAGVDPAEEQSWLDYAFSFLTFNCFGILTLYALQRLQLLLPLNPQGLTGVSPDLSFNTAISFTTNTSWQSYAGETALSYFSQMTRITVQSFLSAASGIAVAIALIRGFARRRASTIGNFWADMVRATVYVLLPICISASLFLIWQGVPQTLYGPVDATTIEGGKQLIARGPVASQIAIKMLSSDGGGFFNANSAHPFENPTALTNLTEMGLIFLIGAALTNTFGRMIGDQRQGWSLLTVMGILFLAGTLCVYAIEGFANPSFIHSFGPRAGGWQHGRQGSALSHRRVFTLCDRDNRFFERRRQRHARQLHALIRRVAHGEHDGGRGHRRWRGLRAFRDAVVLHRHRVSRRAHGRPDAGICR
jgi:K+-transporting ATPase ATPase A chain